jgi:hypothetical protein
VNPRPAPEHPKRSNPIRNPNLVTPEAVLAEIQHDVLEHLVLDGLSPAMRTISLNWANRCADGLIEDYISALVAHLIERVPEIAELAEHVRDELGTIRGLCPAMEARLALEAAEDIAADAS